MNESYLNSVKNTALSSKPSTIIRLLLMVLFVCLLGIDGANAATRTASVTGNWNNTATWGGSSVPVAGDTVIINSGIKVTVTVVAAASSVSIIGTGNLTINNGVTLTVYGNVDVASVAQFNAGTGNSDSAIIKVYGNFTNAGTANFWKSTVVIGGDLVTASTILQNNGEIIVGGNVSGVIGGSGTGIVYPVNPNAVVSVTGNADEKPAGTLPPSGTLLDLTNEVIYGGSCSFTINNIANVPACSGSNAVFTVTTTASSPSYQWQVNSGSGWVDLANSALYSGVSTASLTITNVSNSMDGYKYRAKITSSSCSKSGNYGALTVSPTAVGGTVTGGTTICSGNTSATLTLSGHTGTVVKWQSSVSPFSTWTDIANTSTTYTSGVLTTTTQFRAVVQIGACATATSIVTTVTVNNTNNWTGATGTNWFTPSNWSCGVVPSALSEVSIPNVTNKPIIDDSSKIALANTLTVASGSSLIVKIGNTLKVTDKVTNNGGAITFENSASLVQINNVTNTGNINYKRLAAIRNTDYVYWSTPVSPINLAGSGGISYSPSNLAGSIFYSYLVTSSSEDWQSETASTPMFPGTGYSIRASGAISTNPPGFLEATFTGVPNNGPYEITSIYADKSYLLGNPYPSALDADEFLLQNKDVLYGTLYFWTHNTVIQDRNNLGSSAGTGTFAYTSDDYASYNFTGGVGTGVIIDPDNPTASAIPTGKIGAGQGFFASSKPSITGTKIVFNNDMRVGVYGITGDNTQFFKTKSPKAKTAKIEKNRVWLNLTNTQGAFKQTLVGYVTGATNDIDDAYDGESFDGQEYIDFYSINQDKNLTIQGRALPFNENDEVSLGFRSTIEGSFSISIGQTDGSMVNQPVFIEDKLTNTVFDLKSGNYTFNTAAGTFNGRFVLRYTNKTASGDKTLGLDETEANDGIIVLYSNNYKTLIIRNNLHDTKVNLVSLFNMSGQNIKNWDVQDGSQTSIQIPIKNISPEIYIVKIKTTKGEFRKKIVVKE